MRRKLAIFMIGLMSLSLLISGCSSGAGGSDKTTITVYSAAGADEYYKDKLIPMFEEKYGDKYEVEYGRSTPDQIINKIKAQGENGNINVVITGVDGLPKGMEQGVFEQLLPKYEDKLRAKELNDMAKAYEKKFDGHGIVATVGSGGPILAYNSKNVENPPKTYKELNTWIKAHPNKFLYQNVTSSGPGRGFFYGLMQAKGVKLSNVQNLQSTWDYLKDISKNIKFYPSKTSDSFKYLKNGTVDIIPLIPFWFANLKATGQMPSYIKGIKMKGVKQVIDAQFYTIPKGLSEEDKNASLDFINFAMSKKAQSQWMAVAQPPSNKNASADLIKSKYKDAYQKVVDSTMPKFKKNGKLVTPKNDWVLLPDNKTVLELYDSWESKILSKK